MFFFFVYKITGSNFVGISHGNPPVGFFFFQQITLNENIENIFKNNHAHKYRNVERIVLLPIIIYYYLINIPINA